jgi:glycosyltransferase involved in cell wall biosynthesis
MQAKISVCIPAYHNPQGLGRLLQSLRCQSYRNFEVIVTDDSNDESIGEICGQFADLPGIRYIRNRQRLGAPRNWNQAVSMACGEWIMVMHHDDWLSTNHSLSSFAETADKIGGGWIFSSCDAYKRGLVKGFTHRPFGTIGRYLSTDEISGWPLLFEN